MDKLIKNVIKDNTRKGQRIYRLYKYVGELLVISEKELYWTLRMGQKVISRINSQLNEAGYGCIGSMCGKAHRLPSTVLLHMAMKAAKREDRDKRCRCQTCDFQLLPLDDPSEDED